MNSKVALGVALTCVALAIAIVAVDMRYEVRSSLQAKTGADYEDVATSGPYRGESYPVIPGCAAPDLRLVVHNDQPWGTTLRVRVEASGPGPAQLLVDDEWSLSGGERRTVDFTVPHSVFVGSGDASFKPSAYVSAQVGDTWLSTCVQEAA